MIPRSRDTDPAAEEIQLALLRQASDAQRASLALSMSGWAIDMSKRAIRRARPEATEQEVGLRFVELQYGKDLADRVRAHLARRGS